MAWAENWRKNLIAKLAQDQLWTAAGSQETAQNGSKWVPIGSDSSDLFDDQSFLAGLGRKRIKTGSWLPKNGGDFDMALN